MQKKQTNSFQCHGCGLKAEGRQPQQSRRLETVKQQEHAAEERGDRHLSFKSESRLFF